ncbi:TNT domain-containing protein [Saccharothrix sp. S26]|uniref:TNT domain-containing protein n=1 Tax=Saccharothrix sp. S26 TaxID=2907215 RepID=UPI001F41436D|nr:TNT domain-containing protein [Saccharothrix sp. S26]MCE7000517.1 TNT domain-containing protein [Saccharothrix sp. S26]
MTAPQLDVEDQNAILGSVTTLLVQRLPGDWEQLFVDFRMVGRYLETQVSGLTMYGSSFDWELPPEALPFFVQLRDGMARPGHGTWFTLKFHLVHPDTYSAEFDRDGEPDWTQPPAPQHYAEELEIYPRDDDAVPAWLRERAGLGPARGAVIAAPLFDGPDPAVHARPAVHPQELDDVLAYLENAPVVLAARSYGPDALEPGATPSVPLSFHTDGTWVWPGGVAYYLRNHHLPPVPQLVQHIRDNGYAVPPVDPEAERAAAAVATGQAEGAPLPEHRPRVITEADQRALDHLKERLDHFGVAESEYGIVEPKADAFVIEPAPGPSGWQVQFWDADRGPHGRPRVYEHAVDAAKVLLAELLWRADLDRTRAAADTGALVLPVADIQPLPDEPPLSLFRDRENAVVPVGVELDRFGAEVGNLVYASGTPFGQRSLPPDWLNRRYHVYRVQKPVPALKGVAVPWFGQPGGGTGYFLARSVRDLLADGSLVEVPAGDARQPQPGV